MSDENNEVTPEQVEQEAKTMGWVPEDQYKGPEGTWLDAQAFVERGRHILPILQANNKTLTGKVSQLEKMVSTASAALNAANAAIAALEESHEADTKAQVDAAIKQTKDALAEASKEGDHEAVATLTGKLVELASAAEQPEEKKEKKKDTTTALQLNPEVVAWYGANQDFMSNPRKVALARAVADEFRAAGNTVTGAAFMDMVAAEVEKTLGGGARRGNSKVSGDKGDLTTRSESSGKTYADLPKVAKDACERQAKRLVGPNRAHKDIESWRKSYTRQYFEQEQS